MSLYLTTQQIEHYQQWEKTTQSHLPGRYDFGFSGAAVFAINNNDVLTCVDAFEVDDSEGGVRINYGDLNNRQSIVLKSINRETVYQLINAIDGVRSFENVCNTLTAHFEASEVESLCSILLGHIIENEAAVKTLQNRIRREEIVRFPAQSPYLILRSYWNNCADVREHVAELVDEALDTQSLMAKLADLHIYATMGTSLKSYYGGSGQIPTIPGGYRTHPVRTGMSEAKSCFIDEYLAGNSFGKLLRDERWLFTESQTLLGIVAESAMTFRHPPPDNGLLVQIFDEIRLTIQDIRDALTTENQTKLINALSRLHKLFLHAHPFYNINNSIAMNIVNYCLLKAGLGVVPHLLLDFIALRVEFSDYQQIFSKVVASYALQGGTGKSEEEALESISVYYEALKRKEGQVVIV